VCPQLSTLHRRRPVSSAIPDPRALAILHEWLKATGAEMSEARRRMTRIPKGADLVLNQVSGAPGFWIGNVIVMAGVPSIMQAMLDEAAPKLKTGIRMLSESIRANARESDIGTQLDEIARANPGVAMMSGASATNSAAYWRSGLPAAQRLSMRTLRPLLQPSNTPGKYERTCEVRLG